MGLWAATLKRRCERLPTGLSTVSASCVVPPYVWSRKLMSLRAVVALLFRRDKPTVNATIRPAFLTVVGYASPSRIVSSAVARVRTILQFAGGIVLGQRYACSGVRVAPSSSTWAAAAAGATAATRRAAVTSSERFIGPLNTKHRPQLRLGRLASNGSRLDGPCLQLADVYRLRAFRAGLFLVRHLRALRQGAIALTGDAREMDEQITPSIVRRDEAEALVVAEPLDGTRCHLLPFECHFRTHRAVPESPDQRGKPSKDARHVAHRNWSATAAISSVSPGSGFHGRRSGSPS